METGANQNQSSDFPLPVHSTQDPIRANHPRQLIVYDGNWEPSTDPDVLAGMDYLAVSYRQSDFPDKVALEKMVRRICSKKDIDAYWLDFACTGKQQEEKNEDLYRIADIFRNAKMTLILIKGEDDRPLSEGWVNWGIRIWTFPEALLSTTFLLQAGLTKLAIKELSLNQVANLAYGSDNVMERMLVQLYSNKGKDFSEIPDRFEMLCEAIWSRHSGPDSLEARPSSALTAYPGEKVYALMGFLLHRIRPRSSESEDEAFQRLLDANKLQCKQYPRIAYGSGGARKLGIRKKKDTSRKESYALPEHVPEARFDYNRGRRTCEAGTRLEILDKIYRWLGIDGHRDENDSNLNAESQTDVLWLKGLAGSGKSTIAQTAANKCRDEHILGASFFCFRSTAKLSDYLNIFPTICRLLCQLEEGFECKVSEIYGKDKDLQRAEPDHQLKRLILEPLKAARQFSPCVVIIDALDECSDINARSKILVALDNYRTELKPLKFLITSRSDHDINVAFRTLSLGNDAEKVNLDSVDPSLTERDLRIVLTKGLTDVRQEYFLPDTWPSEEDISTLILQAQNLFIFVSTADKFIRDSSASDPEGRLDLLLKSRTIISKSSPYAYLDNLYREVFRTAFTEIEEELKNRVQLIFKILVLGYEPFSISKLADFTELQPSTIRSTLSKLHALVVIPENDNESIRLIHMSIRDFLIDENRCTDSRFVIKVAAGHSTIAKCCFRTLARFSESDVMRPFLLAPTRRKLSSLQNYICQTDHYAIEYSYARWCDHLEYSDFNEDMLRDFEKLVSNRGKFLLVRYFHQIGDRLLKCIIKLPNLPSSSSDLPSIIYQSAVFLSTVSFINTKELWNALETIRAKYGYKNGLFGLDEETPKVEVAIVYFEDFIPETDVLEMDATVHQLRRAAGEMHSKILQQSIPEDEKLRLYFGTVLAWFYRHYKDIKVVVSSYRDIDTDDYAKELNVQLFAMLCLMKAFNEIFDCILNDNLDSFLTENFSKAFSMANDMQMNALRAILTVSLLGPKLMSFKDMESLLCLFHLPTDKLYTDFYLTSSLAGILVSDIAQIQLTYPLLFSTFFDKANCLDNHFLIDPVIEHSKVALRSMECFMRFPTSVQNMAAFDYAIRHWIFHIDKSSGKLDELALMLLRELFSNRRTLFFLKWLDKKAIPVFLNLINKHLHQHPPPSDIMRQLYEAAIILCWNNYPELIQDIEKYFESIKEARVTLKTCFSYKDGLYDLDSNFPLLSIAISKLIHFQSNFSHFHTGADNYELRNDIRELRNCAIGVHEMIMQHNAPEDESLCSVLRDCITTLYKELELLDWDPTFDYEPHIFRYCLLPIRIKSLKEFRTKVHKILGITDNIRSSELELPIPTVNGTPAENKIRISAMMSELFDVFGINGFPVTRTSYGDANECTSAGSSSSIPPRLLLTIPPESGHIDAEFQLHESASNFSYYSESTEPLIWNFSVLDGFLTDNEDDFHTASLSSKHPRSPTSDSPSVDSKRLRTD